ncbi:hypothetical protein MKX08_008245 [Trichoderma sp. CBMAI-0020]|nr:hypothetical protein MKX08_008245 [Trichoderma sp. CBMAI-0020]
MQIVFSFHLISSIFQALLTLVSSSYTVAMPYDIASDAQFRQKSQGKKNFGQLYQDQHWNASASAWAPLSGSYADDALNNLNKHLQAFIEEFPNRNDLTFKQGPSKAKPLTWRDEKIRYHYSRGPSQPDVVAIDDGGVQIWVPGSRHFRQVVLLEAKRALRNVDGKLQVTDEVLAQMVAQAIAIQRTGEMSTYIAVRQNLSITILATNRFLRIYTFEFDNQYLQQYETLGMGTNGCHLRIHTTKWMDVAVEAHRRQLLQHLSAILRWADAL